VPPEARSSADIEASPLYDPGGERVIVASTDGTIAAHDPATGDIA
jgi:hypothetical protein